jgi:hypothetical protein
LLSACLSRSDSLAPIVTISDPKSGTVRSAENLTIRGYALDDEGIVAIRVDGQDLLQSTLYQSEKGKKLIEFGFRSREISEGQFASVIEAEDLSGRKSTLRFELKIDTTPPSLELDALKSLGEGRVRVSGMARDNNQLGQIIINGSELAFASVSEQAFSLDIEQSSTITVTVEDRAGNSTSQQINP